MDKRMSIIGITFHMVLLIWLILFKLAIHPAEVPAVRDLNLVLLRNSYYLNGNMNYIELLFNILIFIPVGIYLSILKPEWKGRQKILIVFFTSLSFETIQYAAAIGYTDITDLMNNTAGGAAGIGIFKLLNRWWKEKTVKILNIGILVAEILAVSLFFIYRMKT